MRCWWPGEHEDYVAYHDNEWGRPVTDDHRLFEKICLEGFQAGLSWYTILKKRERFREVFADFDFTSVASFDDRDVDRLVHDPGIIRHRGKILSTINNAQRAIELCEEFGSLTSYFWCFEPDAASRPARLDRITMERLGSTPTSTALSRDLKTKGWTFVGPTTVYAFMQAMGLVNDHLDGCEWRVEVDAIRSQ